MGVWAHLIWVAKEETGVGIHQRLYRLTMGRPELIAASATSLLHQFLNSATAVGKRFGPAWTRREFQERPVGAWLLVMCWLIAPPVVALMASSSLVPGRGSESSVGLGCIPGWRTRWRQRPGSDAIKGTPCRQRNEAP